MFNTSLLSLLQLCNSSLPLGAYTYSEGIETLVSEKKIFDQNSLKQWLINELKYSSIKIETAIFYRCYQLAKSQQYEQINYWNSWLNATRETQELREQNWQMGKSLLRLIKGIEPKLYQEISPYFQQEISSAPLFGLIMAKWQIPKDQAILGYLHNWVNNQVSVGVKLIPLGQTEGQKILLELNLIIGNIAEELVNLKDEELSWCSWGLSYASMKHETLYSRLFRS